MGAFSPSGKWSTYNTPMDGEKCANYHSIGFQCRPGSPELNCCSVNAPRGIGILSEWAVAETEGITYINYFERCNAIMESGLEMNIDGDYPADNIVNITLKSSEKQKIAVRIPGWSKNTKLYINNIEQKTSAGQYFIIEKVWKNDTILIEFDFSARYLDGDFDYEGQKSIYKGPVLYGYDLSLNPDIDFEDIPALLSQDLEEAKPLRMKDGRILLKLNSVILSDFYHLGESGSKYRTWLKVK
jgi:DUF1680 family protein